MANLSVLATNQAKDKRQQHQRAQQENQQLGVPLEMARRFPKRLKELCGYSAYRWLYGHVDNVDPITMLGESGEKLIWQRGYDEMYEDPLQEDAPAPAK